MNRLVVILALYTRPGGIGGTGLEVSLLGSVPVCAHFLCIVSFSTLYMLRLGSHFKKQMINKLNSGALWVDI